MFKLVGKEHLNYFSKKSNKIVDGYNLYFVSSDPKVEGMKTLSVYVPIEVYLSYFDIPLDSYVELFYNQYRSVCGCNVLDCGNK